MKNQFYSKIILIVLVLVCETMQSQDNNFGFNNAFYQIGTTPTDIRSEIEEKNLEILNIAHKVYLTEEYNSANVSGLDQSLSLRYNLFKDEMELKRGDEIIYLKKREGRNVVFQKKYSEYIIYEFNNKLRYFELLEDGKNKLLRRKTVIFTDSKKAASSYQKDKPADFKKQSDVHFIKFKDESVIQIPTRKKSFFKIFKDQSSTIKKFVKENNINTKNVKDLKKVVDFLNTL